jgi:exonuclease SbcC
MKIVAIRGKNLASLSGEFCVDFARAPLVGAGLYSITGATGSGKSTLLDALCLALYERTPRLARAGAPGESLPDVGEHRVGPADPRTILRRGAAEGFAEVDFVGNDAQAYRARWSVRRARGKAGGRLQPSEVSLLRLADQQAFGDHRKSETLKLIERCVGLSFEQFTRAVLLAQNDFATFLKASDDERAELLQTLTGSETFSRLSMLAYARARAEGESVKRLTLQLADQSPLTDEARAAKAGELAASEREIKAAEQRQAALAAQLRWHQQAQKLATNVAEATRQLDTALLAKQQAAPRQAQLARIEAVQTARALLVEATRLERESDAGEQSLKAAQLALTQSALRADATAAALAAAKGELQRAEQASADARPALDLAKSLDARIDAATLTVQAALKARDAANEQLARAEQQQRALGDRLAGVQRALHDDQRWLAEQAPQRPLADGWQRWETLLAQAAQLLGERRSSDVRLTALTTEAAALDQSLERARADHAARTAAQQAAASALDESTRALAAFAADELAAQRQKLETRRDQLASASALASALSEHQRRQAQIESQRPRQVATLAECVTRIGECALARPLAERDLAAGEKTLRSAELAAGATVEQLRATLIADDPCPVCGALDHPYARHNPPLAAVLGTLRDEVARQRRLLTELLQRAAAEEARRQATAQQLAALDGEFAAAMAAMQAAAAQWRAHPLAVACAELADEQGLDWLAAEQRALQASLAQLGRDEADYRTALQRRDAAQAAAGLAQNAASAASVALRQAELAHQHGAQALQGALQQLAALDGQLAAAQQSLDAAFPDTRWRERWHANPAAFVARCRAAAEAWAARQRQVAERSATITALAASLQAASAAVATASAQQTAQAEQYAQLASDLQIRQRERAALFGGQPAVAVEAAFGAALTKARTDANECQTSHQQAEADRARQGESLRLASTRLATTQSLCGAAQQALAGWLQSFNSHHPEMLTPAALKALLEFDADWLRGERQALHAVDGAVVSAQAVRKAHQQASDEHLLGKTGEQGAEQLQQALDQSLAELEPARARQVALRLDLARDDERRQRSQSLLADLDRQTAQARVWAQLGELIGSADGKKFRNFAQQLTLDILLGYANRHLATLSRRYRLQRIGDSLGLLVVDRDMGDELRSVHSLSGGESFLVSLALALGLASLSSHRVNVESLFIDEGFGSLDADALSVAMAALDSLQAQGRQIGVISHVAEMSERIGTRIEVVRLAGGQSRVRVAA